MKLRYFRVFFLPRSLSIRFHPDRALRGLIAESMESRAGCDA